MNDESLMEAIVSQPADVIAILTGAEIYAEDMSPNRDAEAKVEEYLEMQDRKHLPTSVADVQSCYQAIPYGWENECNECFNQLKANEEGSLRCFRINQMKFMFTKKKSIIWQIR